MKKRMRKHGQVTIFIIVAIVIVVLGVLIYFLYPSIKATFGFEAKTPSAFMQTCLEDEIENNVEKLSLQGGSLEPELYYLYDNEKVEYLCYSEEDYATCVMQQPMLKEHIEDEIESSIREEVAECFNDLIDSYEKRGYNINLQNGEIKVELLPKRIVVSFTHKLILTKTETERYDKLSVVLRNNLYELVSIANSILNWEAHYGDAETTIYMDYYHDLKVEKLKQTDGTKIYILTDRNTKDKFQFATRSVAWPAGFGG